MAVLANDALIRQLIEINQGLIDQIDAIVPIVNGQGIGDAIEDFEEESGVFLNHDRFPRFCLVEKIYREFNDGPRYREPKEKNYLSWNWTKGGRIKIMLKIFLS
jgi:hypothetical protein